MQSSVGLCLSGYDWPISGRWTLISERPFHGTERTLLVRDATVADFVLRNDDIARLSPQLSRTLVEQLEHAQPLMPLGSSHKASRDGWHVIRLPRGGAACV